MFFQKARLGKGIVKDSLLPPVANRSTDSGQFTVGSTHSVLASLFILLDTLAASAACVPEQGTTSRLLDSSSMKGARSMSYERIPSQF